MEASALRDCVPIASLCFKLDTYHLMLSRWSSFLSNLNMQSAPSLLWHKLLWRLLHKLLLLLLLFEC